MLHNSSSAWPHLLHYPSSTWPHLLPFAYLNTPVTLPLFCLTSVTLSLFYLNNPFSIFRAILEKEFYDSLIFIRKMVQDILIKLTSSTEIWTISDTACKQFKQQKPKKLSVSQDSPKDSACLCAALFEPPNVHRDLLRCCGAVRTRDDSHSALDLLDDPLQSSCRLCHFLSKWLDVQHGIQDGTAHVLCLRFQQCMLGRKYHMRI